MKKEWKEPDIEVLNFKNTHGGGGGGHGSHGSHGGNYNPHVPGGFYPQDIAGHHITMEEMVILMVK